VEACGEVGALSLAFLACAWSGGDECLCIPTPVPPGKELPLPIIGHWMGSRAAEPFTRRSINQNFLLLNIEVFWNVKLWLMVKPDQRSESTTSLRNVGNHLPFDTTWYPRKLDASAAPLWQSHVSNLLSCRKLNDD